MIFLATGAWVSVVILVMARYLENGGDQNMKVKVTFDAEYACGQEVEFDKVEQINAAPGVFYLLNNNGKPIAVLPANRIVLLHSGENESDITLLN